MATDKRNTRVEESHEFDNHDANVRDYLQMTYPDPLAVDPRKIPAGYEYRWIRDSVLGQRDPYRMIYMARKGYTPVPADRHPELCWAGLPWQAEAQQQGYLCHGGLILCERLQKYAQIEQTTLEKVNSARITALPGQDHFMDEPTIPIRVIANSTVFEGQRHPPSEFHSFA